MQLIAPAKRVYWRVLRLFGFERTSWNDQYKSGTWSSGQRSSKTISLVAALCHGGKCLEFGCGEGELPHLLPKGSFSEYLGMDISDVAIQRAQKNAISAGLTNCRFQQADMAKWPGAQGVSLLLAEECLYYLTPNQVEVFLNRASASLAADGRIVIVVHSRIKHAPLLELCRRVGNIVDEITEGERTYLILGRAQAD